ncbi:SPOR domain-containing protein [Chimaeribacter californicus]|uniref:Cell division protein DamX n=1 Tax=Chimaeribacter californicus TaxID=2060067 RepID=A0A2N5E4A8_9GAMM|nr:SPOR domain-containing protein [Chimaeribacter californicus]PLR35827.1 SPOR domain-containing protein [Chimaeribacter californicus]
MDELRPEDDLKPDTSDRRPARRRSASRSSAPRFAISRQHLMIAIGILVLLLLILGIGSALKAPTPQEASQQSNAPKDINLSGNESAPASSAANAPAAGQPQDISVPPISNTPTQAAPAQPAPGQQRVDLPGNMTDALSQQQSQVDTASQEMMGGQGTSTLPTAPATLSPSAAQAPRPVAVKPAAPQARPETHAAAPHKAPVKTAPAAPARTAPAASGSSSALRSAPASHYTLQLSSASRADSLNAFARQQKLTNYQVYQTSRDGKPWFVLVSGNYASSAEAKQAISRLPADVQAKKPWVKPVRQVQQDLKK